MLVILIRTQCRIFKNKTLKRPHVDPKKSDNNQLSWLNKSDICQAVAEKVGVLYLIFSEHLEPIKLPHSL